MVIIRKDMKRKRKGNTTPCNLLDEEPKRTKVHAQRKFAQGSNVSSPVITPVKEIEKQDKQRLEVLPEPQELLPISRPHTEDFLTFLCFRGTSMLPPNLNFFNSAPIDSRTPIETPQKEPINVCPPIANISTRSSAGINEKPFIAFGVRKRADPVLVSKHMDKKRRHALALQALRRKYQEQKMAKIRAVTISKLSEKVTSKSVVRTRSITKNESNKKMLPQKTRVKIISTKHVKVTTRSSIKTPTRTHFVTPIRSTLQKKMCLRSFRGRFIQRELTIKKSKKKNMTKIIKKVKTKQTREISSEFSSDDDQPLKTFKINKTNKVITNKRTLVKKPVEISFRVTRAHPVIVTSNDSALKRKMQAAKAALQSKTPYVKLTPPKLQKQFNENKPKEKSAKNSEPMLHLRTRKVEAEREQKNNTKFNVKNDISDKKINKFIAGTSTKFQGSTETKSGTYIKAIGKSKVVKKNDMNKIETGSTSKAKIVKGEAKEEKCFESLKQKSPKSVQQSISNKNEVPFKIAIEKELRNSDKLRVILEKDLANTIVNEKELPISDKDKNIKNNLEKSETQKSQCKEEEAMEISSSKVKSEETLEKEKDKSETPLNTQKNSNNNKSLKLDNSVKEEAPKNEDTVKEDLKVDRAFNDSQHLVKNNYSEISKNNDDQIEKKKTIDKEKNKRKKLENSEKMKNIDAEPKVSQRPTRKTKEAAAIYMEILGHKLVNEGDLDDDNISIDSFPELPNVRKMEQRENELKAKAKFNNDVNVNENEKKKNIKKIRLDAEPTLITINNENDKHTVAGIVKCEDENPELELASSSVHIKKRITRGSIQVKPSVDTDFSDSDDSLQVNLNKKRTYQLSVKNKKQIDKLRKKSNKSQESDSESDESTTSKMSKRTNLNIKKVEVTQKIDNSFSDSDEEPLSKLTQSKSKNEIENAIKSETKTIIKEDESSNLTLSGKPKRECTKRPQNYLPLFSSSEDEDKYFYSFIKNENKNKLSKTQNKCIPSASADLLCKDVDKRFGKGKVNMSTEQIEQWLKDSALAGGNVKKENEFDSKLQNFNPEVIDDVINVKSDIKDINYGIFGKIEVCPEVSIKPKEESVTNIRSDSLKSEEQGLHSQTNIKLMERKMIFRKENKIPIPKVNAFSANNESSVYAFEADNEDAISTPFRRPPRRPSSTGTSRSEDSSKYDECLKNASKFRFPPVVKQDGIKTSNKQEVSLMLAADESNIEKPLTTTSTSMYPPSIVKAKNLEVKSYTRGGTSTKSWDHSEDTKYKVPSSPSASSSSSTKVTKRHQIKTRVRTFDFCNTTVTNEFPSQDDQPVFLEAPVFYPNEKEFQDPLEYIEKIRLQAEKFGICRIIPPSHFKPECKVSDDMRFTAYNQYVHKMLHRWGPNFKELMAIKKYLHTQNITFTHPPWIGGMEIDLPRLYQIVQSLGGLKEVIEKKKWPKVSELMKIPKSAQDRVTKLDDIYCKYLLPYDTLSPEERDKLFDEVETEWAKHESKALLKSQQKINRDFCSNSSDTDSNDESDECIVKGRSMALNAFYRIARNTMSMWFKMPDPSAQEVEQEFWKHVTTKQNHICVHSGSIDSGSWGYGFAVSKNSPFARHAWNLKVLTNNSSSILRSMGPIMGVTVPTLHVGMVFSACCWYRDPHSLPWIEYLHTGGKKIWYGIPDSMSESFHSTLIQLVPNYCRNKSLWLPSDTAMVPPSVLVENGVSLSRTIQEPGQFIVVFPKAFTSSLCTGYVVSESVYFASSTWLMEAQTIFEELKNNCEPSMFSLERLIINVAIDVRSNVDVLKLIVPIIQSLSDVEKQNMDKLQKLGVTNQEKFPLPDVSLKKRRKLQSDSGDYECEVCCKNLFLSWIIDLEEDSVYCLEHAINCLERKQLTTTNCKLFFTYSIEELIGLINKVRGTIETKLQKKTSE
ncbi:hypothetical protein FQA39_LY17315 [Lamprigera yunnana]|nr:hypothetical protein FQA39_LY17315 [Lamprigera yunnana]